MQMSGHQHRTWRIRSMEIHATRMLQMQKDDIQPSIYKKNEIESSDWKEMRVRQTDDFIMVISGGMEHLSPEG